MHYQEIAEHTMIYNQGLVFSTADSTILNSKTKINATEKSISIIEVIQRKHRVAIHVLSKKVFKKTFIPVFA